MITEDYVSYKTAKLLSEHGFDEPCDKAVGKDEYEPTTDEITTTSTGIFYYPCPTIYVAMKWLREVHHLHCQIDCPAVSPAWQYGIYDLRLKDWRSTKMMGNFDTYEEAAEAAIVCCLKELIYGN